MVNVKGAAVVDMHMHSDVAKETKAENSATSKPSEPLLSERQNTDPMLDDEQNEEVDDEEALFVALEKEKEKEEAEEAAHPHAPPTDIQSAPKLLQDALKTGAVKVGVDVAADGTAIQLKTINGNGKDGDKDTPSVQNLNNDSTSSEEKKNEDGDAQPAGASQEKVSLDFVHSVGLWPVFVTIHLLLFRETGKQTIRDIHVQLVLVFVNFQTWVKIQVRAKK